MPACAIRYRRNGSGPAAYLVEVDGRLHVYTNGVLGPAWPEKLNVTAAVARDFGWVPVKDELVVEVPTKTRPVERRRDDRGVAERATTLPGAMSFTEMGDAIFA